MPLALAVRQTKDPKIACRLGKPWKNGTEGVRLDPMTSWSRPAALIPPPRGHQVAYQGILAPGASHRDRVIPEPHGRSPRRHERRGARRTYYA